ncbi:ATP-grasp fold amidoligase family protein [Salinivibrio kushneri]|uniref:ATP-grasp fold amidoligase family protein n=1 Tax=Salinivibrio kushneri TaxID=1908198 RepID=A0AA47KJ59_9GAMM|nr:ATP-grasp fold amidoligase family protein [Salinivibrio kushneri]WBA07856.1 ATP-grasp fold amidoligase family protein [Salinivibrio kushneri]
MAFILEVDGLDILRDFLRILLGAELYSKARFFLTHHYFCCRSFPRTFSEKIISRKFDDNPKKYSLFVDKYTVREYVERKIGKEYLIPVVKVKDFLNLNDFDSLPNEFVIKASNGGGGKNVLVVEDKEKLDLERLCSDFNRYLKVKMGKIVDEHFYDIEEPKIIIENRIKNNDRTPLLDYKFHRFHSKGETRYLLQINSEYNTKNCTKTLYDLNGCKSEIQFSGYSHGPNTIEIPRNIGEMIEIVDGLAEGFPYVRIDLFNVDEKIYFGEMTFCPASGWDKINTKENDFLLGSWWGE